MNNISNQFPLMGLSSGQNSLPDFRSASYVKEQSLNTRESLDTGLVIHTKDGDQVTLTSSSFSQLDAFMYDSKGVVQTESGTALFGQNQRQISLASGQDFSFSVEGDLSEDELADIDALLKGLDGVISDMMSGDMSGAMANALSLGEFDTVSSFAADISYQYSYQMTSSVATTKTESVSGIENGPGNKESSAAPMIPAENKVSEKSNTSQFIDFDKFVRKLMKQLEVHDEKQVGLSKKPIEKLFNHHLDHLKEGEDHISRAMEKAKEKVDAFLEGITSFENNLANFSEE